MLSVLNAPSVWLWPAGFDPIKTLVDAQALTEALCRCVCVCVCVCVYRMFGFNRNSMWISHIKNLIKNTGAVQGFY